MKFSKISQETFNELQVEAGVILNNFDPTDASEPADEDIICATTGGITVSCVPSISDYGEDVDNCPTRTKELMMIDDWDAKMSFTALSVTAETIKLSLGAADESSGTITPRRTIKPSDFKDIWWVGDLSDGGFAAVKLINALSTSGFSLKTTKKGKGNLSVELSGHYSIDDQETVPMEFYVSEGEDDTTSETTPSEP